MIKTYIQNFLLVVFSTLFALLLAELAIRVRAHMADQATLTRFNELVTPPEAGAEALLGDMIRLSQNDDIIYELQPDMFVYFMEAPVNVNADGFRGALVPREKAENTVRIVGIGDSQMFGWGVQDNETYLVRTEERLRAALPGCEWQTVNTALPGYNTVMEVATLKEKGLAFAPDYVVVGVIGNDLHLPHFLRQQEDFLSLRKSFLVSYLTQSIKSVGLQFVEPTHWRPNFDQEVIDAVPDAYKHMVGEDGFIRAMEELKALSDAHGFEVVVNISNPEQNFSHMEKLVYEVSTRLGFHFVQLYPLWQAYAQANAVPDPDNARFLSEEDPHASVLAHDAMSVGLFDVIAPGEQVRCAGG